MKLYELSEQVEPQEIPVGPRFVKRKSWQGTQYIGIPTKREIGSGMEAMVFDHPTRPGSVVKVIRIRDKKSGQLNLIKISMKHPGNPFLPKIYQAKLIPISEDEDRLYVEMERLHPLTRKDLRHMLPVIFKQIGISKKALLDLMNLGISSEDLSDDPRDRSWDEISDYISQMFNTRIRSMADRSKNPKFKEAIDLLTKEREYWDLHIENVMLRLTPSGPQLVLMDPFS